jgi:hypothetical protein
MSSPRHASVRSHLHSAEVDLLTRSGSAADHIAKDLLMAPGKPLSIKGKKLIRLTCKVPPVKREDGADRPPRQLGHSLT